MRYFSCQVEKGVSLIYNTFGMSGHSKWATIHRQKESKDAARGNLFSKLTRAIQIAVKSSGGVDPESNFKLRVAIEKAKAANMPKENVERAISKAAESGAMEEATYEGFGPEGIAVMVEIATDNKNRTGQEIKNLFERAGGRLAGPGSVSFNFEHKGLIVVRKEADFESQMLKLIDLGVEDIEESDSELEAYVNPEKLAETREKLESAGFTVISFELTQKPKVFVDIHDNNRASKVLSFLNSLQENEDVQKVYANLDIPDEIMKQVAVP